MSEAAAASRYVRRELKYADANGKSILPVALDDAPMRHGLGWLHQIQRVRADAPDLARQLAEAVRPILCG